MDKDEGPRAIDHCVLPTLDLGVARSRLGALGFTVAPQGDHPFGTANACVYFSDGTFLEPLVQADASLVSAAEIDGNVFVSRDAWFRRAIGNEGFSALVLGTEDAGADHARFVDAGISAGPQLKFSRPFIDNAGRADTASFRLAFAAPDDDSPAFFFTCERVDAPKVDRGALEAHRNGVTGIAGVVAVADDPGRHASMLERFTRMAPRTIDDGLEFACKGGTLTLMTPARAEASFGIAPHDASGIRLAAVVFKTWGNDGLRRMLSSAAIPHRDIDSVTIVAPAPGQGAHFAFQEDR